LKKALLLLGVLLAAVLLACPEARPDPAELTVLLVRHGEAWTNVKNAPEGMTDAQKDALTPRGKEQIAALVSAVRGRGVKAIFCSPLGRTRESARILGDALGLSPTPDEALRPFKGDEPVARAKAFVESKHDLGTILVVTHSDVIAELLGEAAGTPAAEREKKHLIPTGTLAEIHLGDGWRLVVPR
jgi:broad specificity phosphatase PhoE